MIKGPRLKLKYQIQEVEAEECLSTFHLGEIKHDLK